MRRKEMFNQLHHLQVVCTPEKLHTFSLQLKFALLTTTQTKFNNSNMYATVIAACSLSQVYENQVIGKIHI